MLEPPGPLHTHLRTVHMACSECLPTRLDPLAERALLPPGEYRMSIQYVGEQIVCADPALGNGAELCPSPLIVRSTASCLRVSYSLIMWRAVWRVV